MLLLRPGSLRGRAQRSSLLLRSIPTPFSSAPTRLSGAPAVRVDGNREARQREALRQFVVSSDDEGEEAAPDALEMAERRLAAARRRRRRRQDAQDEDAQEEEEEEAAGVMYVVVESLCLCLATQG
eukprot:COSAG01_NODE_940_length_12584_cov_7.454218_1_plen_126_part_00